MRPVAYTGALGLFALCACMEPSHRWEGVEKQPKQMADERVSFNGPPPDPDRPPPGEGTRGSVRTPPALAAGGAERLAEAELTGPSHAEARFVAARDVSLKGGARLAEVPEGVSVQVALEQAPTGKRALRVHEAGDCSDIPGLTLGEHFDRRADTQADAPLEEAAQTGELANVEVRKDGTAQLKVTVPNVNLKSGDQHSLLGKALVIHEQEKGKGKPETSGRPIACAVITKQQ
jgi:Cu/Zn superoxide dismutase